MQADGMEAMPVALAAVANATAARESILLRGELHHPGGRLSLRLRIGIPAGATEPAPTGRLWASKLRVESHESTASPSLPSSPPQRE